MSVQNGQSAIAWYRGFPPKSGMYLAELHDGEHVVTPYQAEPRWVEADGDYDGKTGWVCLTHSRATVIAWAAIPKRLPIDPAQGASGSLSFDQDKAIRSLVNEISGIWDAFEHGLRAEISNTNYACVKEKLEAAVVALGECPRFGQRRAPKVRTSHHRNKEEAARLQALVDERYAQSPGGSAEPPTLESVADAIDEARYRHPDHPRQRPRPFNEADRSDREYAIRLARAALLASPGPNPEANAEIDRLRAQVERARAALVIAEDVLSRAPLSTDFWPNGMHPNRGIEIIRSAISALPSTDGA